ncbi:MAG: type II toxin-antitoxin system VapC family toxin [Azonexus sp.]|jgi:tRNA(fMet)-specific endonuclease VapC|nr:type II toxin-antitoxin system VapC family toxin [Azonexus sp.]
MPRYFLDTNICIYAWQKQQPQVLERMYQVEPEKLVISSLVAAELASGVMHSQRVEHNRRWLERALTLYTQEPWGPEAVWHYGRQWARLRAAGTPIGAIDLLLGCQALAEDGIVVTHNVREFERIEGLRIEDWTAPSLETARA